MEGWGNNQTINHPYVSTFKVLVIIHLLSICVNLICGKSKEIQVEDENGVWTVKISKVQVCSGVIKLMLQGISACSVVDTV